MGCDIHLIVQVLRGDVWETIDKLPARTCSWCGGAGHYKGRPTDRCFACSGSGSVDEPYSDRNYTVFSVLADVRNDGYVKPIAEPRGLPEGVECGTYNEEAEETEGHDLGDHSFSWLTLAELLAYDWNQTIEDEGYVDLSTFKAWDAAGRAGPPKEWCAGASGPKVRHVTHSDMRRRISAPYGWEKNDSPYTPARWTVPISSYAKHFLSFMKTLQTLGDPEHVRIVFGFDS